MPTPKSNFFEILLSKVLFISKMYALRSRAALTARDAAFSPMKNARAPSPLKLRKRPSLFSTINYRLQK
jgi:hypothetical protein